MYEEWSAVGHLNYPGGLVYIAADTFQATFMPLSPDLIRDLHRIDVGRRERFFASLCNLPKKEALW
jgi:hypothetical protein